MAETVLVLAPHPDDEVIGCGGAVCLHRRRGDAVHVAFLTSGERCRDGVPAEELRATREAEAREAAAVLGVQSAHYLRLPDLGLAENVGPASQALHEVLSVCAPGVVYLPHPEEEHPDHAAVLPIVRAALALGPDGAAPELRGYEVWSPMTRYDWVEDVSAVMRTKLGALRCYRSQLAIFRYDRAVRGLNRYRGALGAGSHYAEAFRALSAAAPGREASA
jgi:LmbE family N-acetylglucosaminyl deacetylase